MVALGGFDQLLDIALGWMPVRTLRGRAVRISLAGDTSRSFGFRVVFASLRSSAGHSDERKSIT
jgi:hypothetical protein